MPLLIDIPSDSTTALYLRVAKGIENTIRKRQLPPGDQLPSVRELATTLRISRNTVLKAIEVLKKNGVLSAIGGSSVRVASNLGSEFLAPEAKRGDTVNQYLLERTDSLLSKNGKRILSVSADQVQITKSEIQLFKTTSNKKISSVYNSKANCFMDLRNTLDPRGLLELRIAIASIARKQISLSTSNDNVFIFSSREILLNTLCKLILDPVDQIVFSKSTSLLDQRIIGSFIELPLIKLDDIGSKATRSAIKLLFIVASDNQSKTAIQKKMFSSDYTIVDHGDILAENPIDWKPSAQSCTIHISNLFSSPRSRTSCSFVLAPIELTSVLMLAKNQMDRHWNPLQQDAVLARLRRRSGRTTR